MPPSPVVMILRGWKEKHAASPCGRPMRCHFSATWISLPMAQAASSMTGRPCRPAISRMAGRSQGKPSWRTHRMARAFGVSAASSRVASMPYVAGSMSTKTGRAPTATTAFAVAMKLWLTVTTSSPNPTPSARRHSSRAAVQLDTATACGAPTASASSRSNAATSGPCATQPERITPTTASTSASPNMGRTIGICILRRIARPARGFKTVREAVIPR